MAKVQRHRKLPIEQVLRRKRFREFYLAGASGYQAAIAAGYSESYARTQVKHLVDMAEESIRDRAESLGITKETLAEVLVSHLGATDIRWNPKKKAFEKIPDYVAQREAYDRLKEIIEPAPPKTVNHNVKIGVDAGDDPTEATRDGWLKQYGGNRPRQVGQLTTEAAAAGTVRSPMESPGGTATGGD